MGTGDAGGIGPAKGPAKSAMIDLLIEEVGPWWFGALCGLAGLELVIWESWWRAQGWWLPWGRRGRRLQRGLCSKCGFPTDPTAGRCPECGEVASLPRSCGR